MSITSLVPTPSRDCPASAQVSGRAPTGRSSSRWRLTCLVIALFSLGGIHAPASDPPAPSPTSSQPPSQPLSQRIDRAVAEFHCGPPIPLANEWDLHRRVSLDLIGRGPTPEEQDRHQQRLQQHPGDREAAWRLLVDELLETAEFSRQWARVLEVQFSERRHDERVTTLAFRGWIHSWLEQRRPLNELCLEILAADGTGPTLRPAASFFLNRLAEPNLMVRDVGRIFFGRDVQCAQCHDHPLVDDYEQGEFFGLLSFVNRTYLFTDERRGKLAFLGEKADGDLEFASVFQPARGKTLARPFLPMGIALDAEPGSVDDADAYLVSPAKDQRAIPRYSRRQQLAVLATHPENHSFNRNLANRLWSHLLGLGVVHPVDLHHAGNPPVSATLLRQLADELVTQEYDLRAFLRQVVTSHTYQRTLVPPDLQAWPGPEGGIARLTSELATFDQQLAALTEPQTALSAEAARAQADVERAQARVDRVQAEIRTTREALQKQREERDQRQARLTETQARQQKQRELLDSLKRALGEADKAVQLAPDDLELAKSRAGLQARQAAATDALAPLDRAIAEHQEQLTQASEQLADLRGRVVALSNRQLALGVFVVEARGVQRRVHLRQQSLADTRSDLTVKRQRWTELSEWLELRDRAQVATGTDQAADLSEQLRRRETDLVQGWRRGFALRGIRGLSPEQLAASVVGSLGLDQPIRARLVAEWLAANPGQAVDLSHQPELRQKIEVAVTDQVWTVEDEMAERFGAPPGAPQDSFFATTEQALMLQNNPGFLAWLKPVDGTLTQRLQSRREVGDLAQALYRAILARPPEPDEQEQLARWLQQVPTGDAAPDHATLVQELAWGLLTSTEFRFVP